MGIVDFFKSYLGIENEPVWQPVPLDEEFKNEISKYIGSRYGKPYVTQEEIEKRTAELKRKQAENLRREAEERAKAERQKREAEKKNGIDSEKDEEKKPDQIPTGPDVRYSISSDDDRIALSQQADSYFEDLFSHRMIKPNYGIGKVNYDVKPFSNYLMEYLQRSKMTNVEVYKRANLTKAAFSAILSNGHIPKKGTVVALAIAMKLDLKETERLLMKAGYTFSNSIVSDLIAVYFINHKIYDIDKLNSALYEMGEPILGSKTR